jgi:hypothetical protein
MEIENKIKKILKSYSFSEDLIEHIIREKLLRYNTLKDKVDKKNIKETAGVIAEFTKLEDSIVNAIEKYLKLKYPERYSMRQIIHENNGLMDDEKLEEKINELKEIFSKK